MASGQDTQAEEKHAGEASGRERAAGWRESKWEEQRPGTGCPRRHTGRPDAAPGWQSSLMRGEVAGGPAPPLHPGYLRPPPAAHKPPRVTPPCFGAGQTIHESNCVPVHSRPRTAATRAASHYRNHCPISGAWECPGAETTPLRPLWEPSPPPPASSGSCCCT